jgi:hypothetical protein
MSDPTSSNAAPVDATPIDAALGGLAELAACDLALAKRFAGRIEACGDDEDEKANSLARSYQRMARSYRQTLAMTLRLRRELKAEEQQDRRDAEAGRQDAERARAAAAWSHRSRVRSHFERVLWDEYEDDDAQERFEILDARLSEIADEAEFLETPIATLVARLTDEFGVGLEPEAEAEAPSADNDETEPMAAPDDPVAAAPPPEPAAAPPPEPEPPPPPPDPPPRPPEPYIPPWERNPNARYPGGSGY